jgi:hypothetical protein
VCAAVVLAGCNPAQKDSEPLNTPFLANSKPGAVRIFEKCDAVGPLDAQVKPVDGKRWLSFSARCSGEGTLDVELKGPSADDQASLQV